MDHYQALLKDVRTGKLVLPNCDLDSGNPTTAGEYSLTDRSYASLLARLSARNFNGTSPQLRANILAFYADPSLPIETKKDLARWQNVLAELAQLKSQLPAPSAAQ